MLSRLLSEQLYQSTGGAGDCSAAWAVTVHSGCFFLNRIM